MATYNPEIIFLNFDTVIIDGTEYEIMERTQSDSFLVNNKTEGKEQELHIDEITDMVSTANHAEFIRE